MEEQSGGEFASTDPTTRAQDTAIQEHRLRAEIPLNPRRCLQHFQRPTPSHVSTITPRATHCGDGYVARGSRGGLKLPVTLSLRVLDTITRQCPHEPCRRVRSFSRFPCS